MTEADAFLQAIIENPDDENLRLIYADWLEERGDPRGEFIRVQCALERLTRDDPRRTTLAARERELLEEHEEEWLGPIPRIVTGRQYERGFLASVEMPAKAFSQLPTVFGWAPTVRRLLLVGPFRSHKPSLQAIARSPYLARLRSLEIEKGYYYLGPREVAILADSPHLSGLTALSLQTCAMGSEGLTALAASPHLSHLTSLSLSCYGFGPQDFIGVEGVRALAFSPYLEQLITLRMPRCGLDEEGCLGLTALTRWKNLTLLDLRNNSVSDSVKSQLRAQFGNRVHF